MEKVLVVDDSRAFRQMLSKILEESGREAVEAVDALEAVRILEQDGSPDLIILDRIMPKITGDEVCRWYREYVKQDSNQHKYKYFIMLTARNSKDDLIEGLEIGADDYVIKPFDRRELLARLSVGERILDLQRKLRQAATHDSLTGLFNRGAILEQLKLELSRARRSQTFVAIAVIDIDNFKKINDSYGHAIGDEVLTGVAGRIRDQVRDYDLVGRMGGDEFVMVFQCENHPDAAIVCEKVRKAIADETLLCTGIHIPITASVGFSVINGGISATEGVRRADHALYQSKEKGRNRVTCFTLSDQ